MAVASLPFPSKDLAYKELTYDLCYAKIAENHRESIVEAAWEKGVNAAKELFQAYSGNTDFIEIAMQSGLTIEKKDTDYVVGNRRYFSDYISGKKLLILYLRSIALWADNYSLDLDAATNIIVSHEYFHFLEWTSLGLTSRDYTVPMLSIGKLKLGKTGIRALSEIAAHGFAHTYHGLASQKEV